MSEAKNQFMKCPYCQANAKRIISGKDYNRKVSDEIFHLYECQKCGLRFVGNPPDNLGDYYTEDYHGDIDLETIANAPYDVPKIDFLLNFRKSGTLMEIGPSMGLFCYQAQKVGFDVSAIEMDEKCVDFLNNKMKIRAVKSDKPQEILAKEQKKYDVVCMWHSLEHMPEPWTVLEAASNALNKDGLLVIAVPNPFSFQAKLMRKYWPHHDFPRHLFALSKNWLEDFLIPKGLQEIAYTTKTDVNTPWNYFSWGMIFKYFCPFASKKDRFFRKGYKFRLFSKIEEKEGNGSTYVAVFKKV